MHLNVLSLSVEYWVLSHVDVAHVVALQENKILDGNAKILQYSFEPNGFTCNDGHVPVFGFCARQCDCRLLLTTPRYGSAAEGEHESRCGSSVGFGTDPIDIGVPFESNW